MSEYYGYDIKSGYLGNVDGEMMEFPTEEEYDEMVNEKEENHERRD